MPRLGLSPTDRQQPLPKIFPGIVFDLRGEKNENSVERRHYDGFFVHTAFMRLQQKLPATQTNLEHRSFLSQDHRPNDIKAKTSKRSKGTYSPPVQSIATSDTNDSDFEWRKLMNAVENKKPILVENHLAQLSRVSLSQIGLQSPPLSA
jgi:hypothetical protein